MTALFLWFTQYIYRQNRKLNLRYPTSSRLAVHLCAREPANVSETSSTIVFRASIIQKKFGCWPTFSHIDLHWWPKIAFGSGRFNEIGPKSSNLIKGEKPVQCCYREAREQTDGGERRLKGDPAQGCGEAVWDNLRPTASIGKKRHAIAQLMRMGCVSAL